MAPLRKYIPLVGLITCFVVLNLSKRGKRFLFDPSFLIQVQRNDTDWKTKLSWIEQETTYDNRSSGNIETNDLHVGNNDQANNEPINEVDETVTTSVLRDIHITMIGDSAMRYQYLSLTYRLRHGEWFHNTVSNYDLVDEQTFESPFHGNIRNEFFLQTNHMLQPLEVCDCFDSALGNNDTVENRYFYDSLLNNSIVYLAAFGTTRPLQGRILPHQVRNQPASYLKDSFQHPKEIAWRYNDWTDLILQHVRFLDPPPYYIVVNGGIHHGLLKSKQATNTSNSLPQDVHNNMWQAMKNASEFRFAWETTMFPGQTSDAERDEVMCSLLNSCLNMSFSQHVRRDLRRGEVHFREPVYRAANEQMLELLGYLPTDYKMLHRYKLLTDKTHDIDPLLDQSSRVDVADARSSTFAASRKADPSAVLRDIHIVMIGDSVTRYQYLSLAYRLRYGVWFNESLWHYNLVQQGSFQSPFHIQTWGEFLFHSSNVLYPLELCDCYRRPLDVVENRFYYDPILNNSISYFNALGHWKRRPHPMRGRLLPNQIHQERNNQSSFFKKVAFRERRDITWAYSDWADAILGYIRHLDPRPRHIVMNAGHWPHKFCAPPSEAGLNNESQTRSLSIPNETQNLLRAIQLMPEFQFVWKTTTIGKRGSGADYPCDEIMCQLFPICLNVSFTQHVQLSKYWDRVHFYEPVYRALNELMLDDFGYLPKGYAKLNLSDILN
jgi:hypothetical protein